MVNLSIRHRANLTRCMAVPKDRLILLKSARVAQAATAAHHPIEPALPGAAPVPTVYRC